MGDIKTWESSSSKDLNEYYLTGIKVRYYPNGKDKKQKGEEDFGFDYMIRNNASKKGSVSNAIGAGAKGLSISQSATKETKNYHAIEKKTIFDLCVVGKTIFGDGKGATGKPKEYKLGKDGKDMTKPYATQPKNLKSLTKIIQDNTYSAGKSGDTYVELIYDSITSEESSDSGIEIHYRLYNSNGTKYVRGKEATKPVIITDEQRLKKVFAKEPKDGLVGTVNLGRVNALEGTHNLLAGVIAPAGGYKYTLHDVAITYRECGAEEDKNYEDSNLLKDAKDAHGNPVSEYWDGHNGGTKTISDAALSRLKEKSFKNVDLSAAKMIIELRYYEPQVPAKNVVLIENTEGGELEDITKDFNGSTAKAAEGYLGLPTVQFTTSLAGKNPHPTQAPLIKPDTKTKPKATPYYPKADFNTGYKEEAVAVGMRGSKITFSDVNIDNSKGTDFYRTVKNDKGEEVEESYVIKKRFTKQCQIAGYLGKKNDGYVKTSLKALEGDGVTGYVTGDAVGDTTGIVHFTIISPFTTPSGASYYHDAILVSRSDESETDVSKMTVIASETVKQKMKLDTTSKGIGVKDTLASKYDFGEMEGNLLYATDKDGNPITIWHSESGGTAGEGGTYPDFDVLDEVQTIKFKKGCKDRVEVHLYYEADTPPKPTPSDHKTEYKWDDTENSGKSWSVPKALTPEDAVKAQGMIQGDTVTDGRTGKVDNAVKSGETITGNTYSVLTDPAAGIDGEIMLPNGSYNSAGEYVANTLKSQLNATSYLTKGKVSKHETTYNIPFRYFRKYKGGVLRTFDVPIQVSCVWFSLDYVEIFKPNRARVYNYAFKNTDLGERQRSPIGAFYENLSFKGSEASGAEWKDTGIFTQGTGGCSLSDTFNPNNLLINLGESSQKAPEGTPKDLERAALTHFNENFESMLKGALTVKSDTLIFNPPSWEPGEDESSAVMVSDLTEEKFVEPKGVEYGDDGVDGTEDGIAIQTGTEAATKDKSDTYAGTPKLDQNFSFREDTVACITKAVAPETTSLPDSLKKFEGGIEIDLTDTPELTEKDSYQNMLHYSTLASWGLNELRIPQAKVSNNAALFYQEGSTIDEQKMNTCTNRTEPVYGADGKTVVDSTPDPDDRLPVNNSRLEFSYTPITSIGIVDGAGNPTVSADAYYSGDSINKVTIHTPIASRAYLVSADTKLSQSADDVKILDKDGNEVAMDVTLGSKFTIGYDLMGEFGSVESGGYGTLDTEKYAKHPHTVKMKFSFPVYVKGSDTTEYHEANKWFEMERPENYDYYPAYWSDTGLGTVTIRQWALNDGEGDAGIAVYDRHEETRVAYGTNSDRYYYGADGNGAINLTGRLFGLRQYDVSDYPTLQGVFRQGNTYKKTDKYVASGNSNFLGEDSSNLAAPGKGAAIFPVINGDKIDTVEYGVYKTGYVVRWNVNTIGNYNKKNSWLQIEPTFYWVPKGRGLQAKQEVKLYYDEKINGMDSYLVEVGSTEDSMNRHQLRISDREAGVDLRDLYESSVTQGYQEFKIYNQKVVNAWTYSGIDLPVSQAVNEGNKYEETLEKAVDGTILAIPDSVKEDGRLNACMQTWYGEYYLPNDLHVRLTGSENDDKFAEDGKSGYDYSEDYWVNDGYLVVNFDPAVSVSGKTNLLYDATNSTKSRSADREHKLNMWSQEKYQNSRTDGDGQSFDFADGDFIVYNMERGNSSMSDDYRSGGTH